VPGEYAAFEARRALRSGLHVFLFSDNVSLEEEIGLKSLGDDLGLLVMGPDCGTALIGGAPLGFANAVRRGGIGIVASSGTGLQEVSTLVHRFGEGVSNALGTGGRDLWAPVGGRTFLAALDALGRDPLTRALLLIAKPGAPEIQARIYDRLAGLGKPSVVYFLGAARESSREGVVFAEDLEHAARCAVALLRGEPPPATSTTTVPAREIAQRLYADLAPGQTAVRGLFAGGTLAQEAATAIRLALGAPEDGDHEHAAGELLNLCGHRVLDLGDDAYTRGRPHPLIDPRLRNDQIVAEAARGDVALFLVDIILGYGAHADPAGALRPALERAREAAARAGGRPHVLASITGTEDDPQSYDAQRAKLEGAGVVVAESSSVAAQAAGCLARLAGVV
jgi:FdrA protein